MVGGVVHAQTGQTPSSRTRRVDVAVTVLWTTTSPIVKYCCELRTPPSFQQVDESQTALLAGVDLRVHETPRTSTVLQMGWGPAFEYDASYPRPTSIDPIFAAYTAERDVRTRPSFDLGVMQALEFRAGARVRPWVAGGLLLSRMSAEQVTEHTFQVDAGRPVQVVLHNIWLGRKRDRRDSNGTSQVVAQNGRDVECRDVLTVRQNDVRRPTSGAVGQNPEFPERHVQEVKCRPRATTSRQMQA